MACLVPNTRPKTCGHSCPTAICHETGAECQPGKELTDFKPDNTIYMHGVELIKHDRHLGHYDFCCTNLLGKLTTFQAAIRSSGHASSGSQDSTIGPASAVASADVFSMTWAQSS